MQTNILKNFLTAREQKTVVQSLMILWLSVFISASYAQSIIYVDIDATGANNGTSWNNAYTDLHNALADSSDEIWVAEGTYRTGATTKSFHMQNNRALYGGFQGIETNRSDRDPQFFVTALSGDTLGNDGGGTGVNAIWANMQLDNARHVLWVEDVDETCILDGFTVTRGWSWESTGNNSAGAGMFLINSSPIIRNCMFTLNLSHLGAGCYSYISEALFENCEWVTNLASDGRGGGLYLVGDYQTEIVYKTTLNNCSFSDNEAHVGAWSGSGGAIWLSGNAACDINDSEFIGNRAKWRFQYGSTASGGGAITNIGAGLTIKNTVFRNNSAHIGGAIWGGRNMVLENCLFEGNYAFRQSVEPYDYGGYGGAIYSSSYSSPVEIRNSTFTKNHANSHGGLLLYANTDIFIKNSIIYGNTSTEVEATVLDSNLKSANAVITNSCVEGLWEKDELFGSTNIDMDPVWVDPVGGDFRLGNGSPCIDAGNNAHVDAGNLTDLGGNIRKYDDPATADSGQGSAPLVDMGCYEFGPWIDYGTNQLPMANYDFVINGVDVTFTDTSTDDGTILTWFWDFGDGSQTAEQNPAHTYTDNGNFPVRLIVRDNQNGTASIVKIVSITEYTPPALMISNPIAGEVVGNTIDVAVDASVPSNLVEVKYYVDGNALPEKGKTPPNFITQWDTLTVADGPYQLTARGTDINENETWAAAITVIVNNTIPRILSQPSSIDANVGSLYSYQVVASGNPDPSFSLDTRPDGMAIDPVSGLLTFTPTPAHLGIQNVVIRAENTGGADTQSFFVNVIDNEAPSQPQGTDVVDVTETSARLVWQPSTDNVDVIGYQLWYYQKINQFPGHWRRSNTPLITSTTFTVSPSPTARYTPKYAVAAVDAAGNESARSATMAVILNSPAWIYHNPIGEVFQLIVGAENTYIIGRGGSPTPTLEIINPPAGATIDNATGLIHWTPAVDQVGTGTITVRGYNVAGEDFEYVAYNVQPDPASLNQVNNITQSLVYSTIQEAVDAANVNDFLEVEPGTYTEDVVLDIPLTLQAASGAAATIIDNSVMIDLTTTGGITIVDGFTITTGKLVGGNLAAVHLLNGSSDVDIVNCMLSGPGSGINFGIHIGPDSSNLLIENNGINGWSTGLLSANAVQHFILDNAIDLNGSGIECNGLFQSYLARNMFAGNSITCFKSTAAVSNFALELNQFETSNASGVQWFSGAVIDARNNWWGDASGPSSAAGTIIDPVSGTPANGSGSSITNNVQFDPMITLPVPNITILNPTGTAVWQLGTVHNIQWNSSGFNRNVKLFVSVDGGPYQQLAGNHPNTGSFAWTVDQGPSANVRIRISAEAGNAIYGESELFETTAATVIPSIIVTAPISSNSCEINTEHAITWTSTNIPGNVKIYARENSGSAWTLCVWDTPNSGSYLWNVNIKQSTTAQVRVVAMSNNGVFDNSNQFTVTPATVNPTITVTNPTSAESLQQGTIQAINWITSDIAGNVKVYVRAGAGAWQLIAWDTPNDGLHDWTVNLQASTQAVVRVVSMSSNAVFGESAPFTVSDSAITVLSPSASATWTKGNIETITWLAPNLVNNVNIFVSLDGGPWLNIGWDLPNTGSHNRKVNFGPATTARVRVTSMMSNLVYGESADFTIAE